MNIIHNRIFLASLKLYIAITLITAAILSPLALSVIPVLILAWYLYLLRWPVSSTVVLLTRVFIFFAIVLLYTPKLGSFLPLLISCPVIFVIFADLEDTALTITSLKNVKVNTSRPTSIYITLLANVGAALGISLLTSNLSLLISSIVMILFSGILGIIALRKIPVKPVETEQIQHRMVAGTTGNLDIELNVKTGPGGLLFLESSNDRLVISPEKMLLKGKKLSVNVTISPELSGPSVISLNAQVLDRWGLFRTSFILEPVKLFVIPRAQYAAWLAEKYLSETARGNLPLISNLEARKPAYGLRRGIEYYSSRLYQAGDSLKNIDWKHSVKYNELISKEYIEHNVESAILLINLSVGDAKEADILAYNIIMTALSLAQDNIPGVLAVYDHKEVRLTTTTLHGRHLVARCLQVAREMVTYINPVKYLNPPDIARLRRNINRIHSTESKAAKVLLELMRIEYKSIGDNAKQNPATKALIEALAKAEKQSNIVIISQRNHDAEALAYNTITYTTKGNTVINIERQQSRV
jgi:uncharacterized protein (DUF58 family)